MIFYLDILNFDKDRKESELRKEDFQSIETGYTARIKQTFGDKKQVYMYSEVRKDISKSMQENYNAFVLKYINKTRAIARNFPLQEIKTYNDLNWNSFMANLPSTLTLYCIDIKSAYFKSAVNIGLLTSDYIEEFEDCFSSQVVDSKKNNKLYKNSRLAVLGSLATKRRIRDYEEGICIKDTGYEVYDSKMRNVYVDVCRQVDNLMIELCQITGTCGYYWDCVFATSEQAAKKVQQQILEKGFEFKTEKRKSKIYYYPNGGGAIQTGIDLPKEEQKIYQFNYRKVIRL